MLPPNNPSPLAHESLQREKGVKTDKTGLGGESVPLIMRRGSKGCVVWHLYRWFPRKQTASLSCIPTMHPPIPSAISSLAPRHPPPATISLPVWLRCHFSWQLTARSKGGGGSSFWKKKRGRKLGNMKIQAGSTSVQVESGPPDHL